MAYLIFIGLIIVAVVMLITIFCLLIAAKIVKNPDDQQWYTGWAITLSILTGVFLLLTLLLYTIFYRHTVAGRVGAELMVYAAELQKCAENPKASAQSIETNIKQLADKLSKFEKTAAACLNKTNGVEAPRRKIEVLP